MARFYSTRSAFLRLSFVALIAGRVSCAVTADASDTSDARPLRVEVSAPKSCPKAPALIERVRTHTPHVREASTGESAELLRVDIVPARSGFVADLRLTGDDALDRRVSGKTCEEVLAAVALIVALNVDATARQTPAAEPLPDASVDAPSDAGPTRIPTERTRDAGPKAKPVEPIHVRPSLGTSLEAYGVGRLTVANSIWVEGSLTTRFAPSLRLRLARSRSFTETTQDRPAFFRLSTASLEGCAQVLRVRKEGQTVELRPCLLATGGIIEGKSSAAGPLEEKKRPWASLGSLLQLRWTFLGPLALEVGAGFVVALFRDEFFFRPGTPLYKAPAVLLVGDVGIGATFR